MRRPELESLRERTQALLNANDFVERKYTRVERFAMWVTEKVGTGGFAVFIVLWLTGWAVATLFWPVDDAQFSRLANLAELLGLLLLPVLLISQNAQSKHAEARADFSFLAQRQSAEENKLMLEYLDYISRYVPGTPRGPM